MNLSNDINCHQYQCFSVYISKFLCQTLLNALDKSKKIPQNFNKGLASKALKNSVGYQNRLIYIWNKS